MRGEICYNVPIFPLNTVLFPSMPLPLHIFEDRYKEMVEDLRKSGGRFCVALIEEGEEVGGYAQPYEIGCLAEVVQWQPKEDGRYFLVAVGVERVKILSIDRISKPYLTGSVEMLPDECPQADPQLVRRATRLFLQYVHYIMKLSGQSEEKLPIPREGDLLSYMLATALQVEPDVRQRLLEIPDSNQRLKAEVELLHNELPMLQAYTISRRPPKIGSGKFSAN